MICPFCHGAGKLRLPPIPCYAGQGGDGYHNVIVWCFWSWCSECGGSGRAHCCEGDACQPGYDPEADAIGSYYDAIRAIGAAVKAGAPVPAFMLSERR